MVGGIKLQVAAKDAERANEVLASLRAESPPQLTVYDSEEADEAEDSNDGVSLNCPECGAEIWFPPNAAARGNCPECGAP